MTTIQGPTQPAVANTNTDETSTRASTSQAQAQAQAQNIGSPPALEMQNLSSNTLLALQARQLNTMNATSGNPQTARAVAQNTGARLQQTAESDLFTRLETSQQGSLLKADGKMGRSDLRAALSKGGLTPRETVIAEYLLANFDSIASGRHMRPSDLQAHAAGVALSASPNLPIAGLNSFMDDRDASSFFGFFRHDKDFRDLANGTSISRSDLEEGLNDNDFSPAQKQAIQFMLDNLDAIGGSDGRIQEKELKTFMQTVQRSQVSHAMGDHRPHIQNFALDDNLYNALSGSSTGRGTITVAELQQALTNDSYSTQQKAAISFLLSNFTVLSQGEDKLKRSDLHAAAFNDIAMLNKGLNNTTDAYRAAATARSPAFDNPEQLANFVSKVDGLFKGDDQGDQLWFISINRGGPGDEKFDHRSTFRNPISLFSNQEAPTDGHISRNDLQRALSSDVLTADEQNLALILLNNFTSIGGGLSTVNAEQIGQFLNTFDPTALSTTQTRAASAAVPTVTPMLTKI